MDSQKRNSRSKQDGSNHEMTEQESGFRLQSRLAIIISTIAVIGGAAVIFFFFTSDITDRIASAKKPQVYAMTSDKGEPDIEIDEEVETDSAVTPETPLLPSMSVDKTDMIAFLDDMSEAEFQAFIDNLIDASASIKEDDGSGTVSEGTTANENDEAVKRKTLEEAYAQAEARYPGQIDGSKRLQLIAELNAIDFMYYVVEKGDTLLYISESFNVPLGQLVEMNGLHNANRIDAGMILLFPIETVQPELSAN